MTRDLRQGQQELVLHQVVQAQRIRFIQKDRIVALRKPLHLCDTVHDGERNLRAHRVLERVQAPLTLQDQQGLYVTADAGSALLVTVESQLVARVPRRREHRSCQARKAGQLDAAAVRPSELREAHGVHSVRKLLGHKRAIIVRWRRGVKKTKTARWLRATPSRAALPSRAGAPWVPTPVRR